MATTFAPTASAPAAPLAGDGAAVSTSARTTAVAAIATAVLGAGATLFLDTIVDEDVAATGGRALVEALDDGRVATQLSCAVGLAATVALLVLAAGLRRRLQARGLADTTPAQVLDRSLTASAGAMFLGFGARAVMAGALPSGVDGDFYTDTGREAIYAVLNNVPYLAWMGVAFAAGSAAVLAFRHGAFTRPVGVVGALSAVVVTVMTFGLGLPYSSSLVAPLFLLTVGASLARQR